MLSALVIGLLFAIGVPTMARAAGPCSAPNSCVFTVTVFQNYQIANGSDNDSIQIYITDAVTGLPVNGVQLNITLAGATASNTYTSGSAPWGTGIVKYGLNSLIAGSTTVTIKVLNSTSDIPGSPVTVNFVTGPPDPTNPETRLVVDKGTATADGVDKNLIHAHLVDAVGNPITDVLDNVSFFIIPSGAADANAVMAGGGNNFTPTSQGNIYLNIADITAGTVQLGATYKYKGVTYTITFGSPAPVTFVAGPPDATNPNTRLVVDIPQATADGTSTTKIHAHLVDKKGNVITQAVDNITFFVIPSGPADATAVLSGGGNNLQSATGDFYLTIADTKTGTVQLGATYTYQGVTTTIVFGSPAPVKFVSDGPDVTNPETKLVVDIPKAAADGSSITKIHAHLVDKNGLLVNVPVTINFFVIPSGPADATAAMTLLGSNPVTPDANGDIYLTITNTVAGTVQLGATVTYQTVTSTITNGSPAPVTFVVNAPDPNQAETKLVVDIPQATADGASPTQVHAHLVNSSGAVIGGYWVYIEFFVIPSGSADATAVLAPPSPMHVQTLPSGDINLTITNTKVGTVKIGAKISTDGVNYQTITNGSPAPVQFVAGQAVPSAPGAPSGTGTMLTIVKDFVPADGTSTDKVNAHITDAFGNPVKDTTVTFSIRAGGTATATAQLVGTVTVKTDANGDASMSITNTVGGTVWIDASIIYNGNPTALIDGSYKEITFTNLPDVTNPETKLIVVVYEALADGQSTTVVKAHVVDQNGVVLSGQEVKFSIDSGTAQIITPGPWLTDANGDVSIELTSTKQGFVLVTATVSVSGVDKPITFGSPARVKFATINIYVPKVFTPNGDGSNDVLKPILVGISSFHYFNVYNRWGNMVFTTQDPNHGWDGTFKGVPQPVETYLWIAEGIDINGKKIVAKGMTSLVK